MCPSLHDDDTDDKAEKSRPFLLCTLRSSTQVAWESYRAAAPKQSEALRQAAAVASSSMATTDGRAISSARNNPPVRYFDSWIGYTSSPMDWIASSSLSIAKKRPKIARPFRAPTLELILIK